MLLLELLFMMNLLSVVKGNVHAVRVLQEYLNGVLNHVLYLVLIESWEVTIWRLLLRLQLLIILLLSQL